MAVGCSPESSLDEHNDSDPDEVPGNAYVFFLNGG